MACFPTIVKNDVFVAKIRKNALYESPEGFCCGPRKPANPCHPGYNTTDSIEVLNALVIVPHGALWLENRHKIRWSGLSIKHSSSVVSSNFGNHSPHRSDEFSEILQKAIDRTGKIYVFLHTWFWTNTNLDMTRSQINHAFLFQRVIKILMARRMLKISIARCQIEPEIHSFSNNLYTGCFF